MRSTTIFYPYYEYDMRFFWMGQCHRPTYLAPSCFPINTDRGYFSCPFHPLPLFTTASEQIKKRSSLSLTCRFTSGQQFLDASSHFYKRVCPSVRPSVRKWRTFSERLPGGRLVFRVSGLVRFVLEYHLDKEVCPSVCQSVVLVFFLLGT